MASGLKAAVVGASGYAGAELVRLLLGHPSFEVSALTASDARAGTSVRSYLPNLVDLGELAFAPTSAAALADADIVFTALPPGESATLLAELDPDQRVVDLGADFRLSSAEQWQKYYGGKHAGTWIYGLPEVGGLRDRVLESTHVANPGCYATAIQLALAPLLNADSVQADDIVVVAASGTSGAGRKSADSLLASNVMGSMSPYKVGGVHQHTPEIEQQLSMLAGTRVAVNFTPLLAPMSRGILATVTARLAPAADPGDLREELEDAYADEPFVHVLPEGQWPQTSSVYGTNACHLQLAYDDHTGRVVVVSAIDNLGKGAAGQALQNANLLFRFEETTGLTSLGVAP
jgi:N-acetyl-gamma-glutamyl-phosphate reductase